MTSESTLHYSQHNFTESERFEILECAMNILTSPMNAPVEKVTLGFGHL